MKCLTICQPYASLILLPDDNPQAKRVENRRWPTIYRGPLLIHAGKSTEWLDSYRWTGPPLQFGAILGVCELVDCVAHGDKSSEQRRPWLKSHRHYEGPWCFVLGDCRAFSRPLPWRGAQGLFDVADNVDLAAELRKVQA